MNTINRVITILLTVVLIGISWKSQAQDKTRIGIYVNSISDLNYVNSTFSADLWWWRVNESKDIHDFQRVEFMNVADIKDRFSSTSLPDQQENIIGDSIFWEYEKVKGVFRHVYDIGNFPFDKELLEIDMEDMIYSTRDLQFILDRAESGISKEIAFQNWRIDTIQFETYQKQYETNFGDPNYSAHSAYPGIRVLITIKRDSFFLFVKLFTGLFVAFIIALFSLKIHITEADARFGACVGGLFACIANMYIVNSNLPMVSQITMIDQLHVLTFFCVVVLFIISTISLKYYRRDQVDKSLQLDRRTFNVITVFYAASVLAMFLIYS